MASKKKPLFEESAQPPRPGQQSKDGNMIDAAQAGDAFAMSGTKPQAGSTKPPPKAILRKRKPSMKKPTVDRAREFIAANQLSSVKKPLGEIPQELMAPHEWDELLSNFENDSEAERGPATMAQGAELELSSDDLWERLSSTRWLKKRAAIDPNRSTVSQQPPATD